MNRTEKLWKPLSGVVRQALRTTCRFELSNYNYTSTSWNRFLNSSSFSRPYERCRSGANLTFWSETFCSESADRVHNVTCWNCNAVPETSPFLFCESCRSVQPVDQSVNYFQIFGLGKKYEIEDGSLEGKYKDWQKKLHPDLVHSKSEREKEYAAEQSACVIEAYRTLRNPLSRAIYIMRLEGVDVNEEETVSEPELLTEIMEIREAVEDATDSQALNQIKSTMQEKLMHWSNSFANAFQNHKFDDALICIRRMTYYSRVNEEIAKKL
ncbi:iron-sulfur cluster co-chaperone protein HscB homolog [Pistacia vera]|uniref:iron-sulfur cluster co-chaperone protein HscB homolog n=1 Tax=Pistacia vera TaxID=55513 RepID=UPI00126388A2|nr:iron-sulfur cluster co-chaperone protein HscB homolog [Pistacia vera]XP_031279887.1 iron-sulfur cluster co-chaperone protein HscB homolog [Pistacia vera]XP_031279888.1 iron-sulfur cluster co-chaperone protein HscB homolog [Pistacia vera]XP_031279889.1 iron-sulfur cluster co-chaperone protein HscB homolog [Pistacia vera]